MNDFFVRSYRKTDLPAIRVIYGDDEFARPALLRTYPRLGEYLADEAAYYYTHFEPESLFVAEVQGTVVGALLGAVETSRYEQFYTRQVQPYLLMRCLSGAYGWPAWAPAIWRTELAGRNLQTPPVDLRQYPAHLHIGILPVWRRKGLGSALMTAYTDYLRAKAIPGYHLYAASFHPLGIPFYRKLGLEQLGQFDWRLHTGYAWQNVTETIFGQKLG